MSRETLETIEPGFLTTVQDRGRTGYQRFGVPISGAMDMFALLTANILVGNDEGAAGLEMTVMGPKLRFLAETWIAITGADLAPSVDDGAVPQWHTVKVPKDSVLSFQGARDGVRSYLAVAGGIDVPVVMGSRSTYLKGAIGGLHGRALRAGDVLGTEHGETPIEIGERGLPEHLEAPTYGHKHEIRVVLGPQDRSFTSDGVAKFLGSPYSVSVHSDRMGYRLEGPPIEHVSGADIVSDGTALGAVQVPGDGRPIVLLADRGTTGGYTKIATVISADMGKLAQAMPGDTVTFQAVTVEQAHQSLREQHAILRDIRKAAGAAPTAKLSVVVDGEAFEVADEAGERVAVTGVAAEGEASWTRHATATVDGRTYEFEVEVRQVD